MSAQDWNELESSLGERVGLRREDRSRPGPGSFLELPDRQIAYRLEGCDSKPVVMLAHGLLADLTLWDEVAAALTDQYRVLRYDLRGHGNSTATAAPYTLGTLADDVVAVLDALAIERVHFVGTSIGGMIGQQLGLAHGPRLTSLVLAHTAARQPAPKAWHERIATARACGVGAVAEPAVQRWLSPAARATGAELLANWTERAAATSLEGYAGCAAAIAGLDFASSLMRISTPALVVAGAQDEAIDPELSLELHRGLPDSTWAWLDPAAHQSALECPERLLAACTAFWAALPRARATAASF